MSIRTNLIIEHNINILIDMFNHKHEYINGVHDIKLRFIELLLEFKPDEIAHGISYMQNENNALYKLLYPLVIEYNTYGVTHFQDEPEPVVEEVKKQTFLDKIKSIFKKEDKNVRVLSDKSNGNS